MVPNKSPPATNGRASTCPTAETACHDGCRNIDLCSSTTTPGRLTLIQKWESFQAQQDHFDSADMVEMAKAAQALLREPPRMDLLDPISAHDLA